MSYTDVPASIDETFSVSQPKIKENFTDIKTAIEQDHVAFGATGVGKHQFITVPEQTVSGTFPPLTSADEIGIYCKTDGTNPALFIRPTSQTVGVVTNDINFTSATLAANGWGRLPCGLKMAWGTGTMSSPNQSQAFTFAETFTTGTAPYSIQITPIGSHTGVDTQYFVFSISNLVATGFTVERGANYKDKNISFYYTAIGI